MTATVLQSTFLEEVLSHVHPIHQKVKLEARLKEGILNTWPKDLRRYYNTHPELFTYTHIYSYGDILENIPMPIGVSLKGGANIVDVLPHLGESDAYDIHLAAVKLHKYNEDFSNLKFGLMQRIKNCGTIDSIVKELPELVQYTQWDYKSDYVAEFHSDPLVVKFKKLLELNRNNLCQC